MNSNHVIHTIWNKKEEDGSWVVKAIHETRSVWGYGDSLQEAREDCRKNLESSFKPDKFDVLI